jgi:ABC-type polysaccharide/polyol phosphate transport system ATPase subunit
MAASNLRAAMAAPSATPVSEAPVVIEARGVEKTFRIPRHRVDSLKERVVRPFTRADYRELRALRDVSFDVHRGEFFGIVGRNGSGKSTLLKVMASIYRADAGRIRMAGRVAPFIELGVGFNPELTARDNVVLNGVMMGLSRREAVRRLDAVLEFAELEDFVELKLKNYSSGMMVRLAFAVMVQADSDIMLIDEVLAVGDASFAQKCMDVFHEKRRAGKTIVLVTHDMATVQALCHRAMLIHDGELRYVGDPEETAMRYYRLNFGGADGKVQDEGPRAVPDVHTRLVDAWFEDEAGQRVDNLEQGTPIRLNVVLEARAELRSPIFAVHVVNADGATVFGFRTRLKAAGEQESVAAGRQVRISATVENPLVPGRYLANCHVYREGSQRGALQVMHLPGFVVFGTAPAPGLVSVKADVEAVAEPEVHS